MYVAVLMTPEFDETICHDTSDLERVLREAKEYSAFENTPVVILEVADLSSIKDLQWQTKDIHSVVFADRHFTETLQKLEPKLLINELPDMNGESLSQKEIELLNETLNHYYYSKFPLFEGLGYEKEMEELVSKDILQTFDTKQKLYCANTLWRNYVKLVLVDW